MDTLSMHIFSFVLRFMLLEFSVGLQLSGIRRVKCWELYSVLGNNAVAILRVICIGCSFLAAVCKAELAGSWFISGAKVCNKRWAHVWGKEIMVKFFKGHMARREALFRARSCLLIRTTLNIQRSSLRKVKFYIFSVCFRLVH